MIHVLGQWTNQSSYTCTYIFLIELLEFDELFDYQNNLSSSINEPNYQIYICIHH
jgi:hypothetical protein